MLSADVILGIVVAIRRHPCAAGLGRTVTIGARSQPTLPAALAELEVEPDRAIVVTARASGVTAAREAKIPIVIAAARGFASPEELRQAGANTVVADQASAR